MTVITLHLLHIIALQMMLHLYQRLGGHIACAFLAHEKPVSRISLLSAVSLSWLGTPSYPVPTMLIFVISRSGCTEPYAAVFVGKTFTEL